jgi:hypothetical protein
MDTEHVTAVCTGLGSLREDASGRDVYVKHADCLGTWEGRWIRCVELM